MRRRTTARLGAAALGTVLTVSLTACTPPLPEPQPDAVPAVVQPAVTEGQVESVLAEVTATLEAADTARDAEALAPRVTGPAAAIRGVQYRLAEAGPESAVTPIPAGVQTVIAPATLEWPRPVMAITEPPEDLQPPLLLTLVQDAPRDPYRLWAWVRLFPGAEIPATNQPTVGSEPLAPDSGAVAVPPAEVVDRYTDVLTNGSGSEHAELFADDPLRSGIGQLREALAALVVDKGSLTETYTPVDDLGGPYALATADGGAIVVDTFRTVTSITLADSTLTIADETAALLGSQTVASNLEITWLSTVAFAVPPADSTEPVTVLGAEHSRVQVTGQ